MKNLFLAITLLILPGSAFALSPEDFAACKTRSMRLQDLALTLKADFRVDASELVSSESVMTCSEATAAIENALLILESSR